MGPSGRTCERESRLDTPISSIRSRWGEALSMRQQHSEIRPLMIQDATPIPLQGASMKKVVFVVLWFVFFMGVHAVILWNLPNRFRVHPRLARPILVNPISNEAVTDSPICLVGDCFVRFSPWPYRRIAHAGTLRQMIPAVRSSRLKNVERFVVMGGQHNFGRGHSLERIAEEMQELRAALSERYPEAEIYVIPPIELHELASQEKTGYGWHLNKLGYEVLYARHPALRYPTWNGKSQSLDVHLVVDQERIRAH